MIVLRSYKSSDAEIVVNWITDEKAFRLWCADRFENYPLSAEAFNSIYTFPGSDFFGMIAEDEGKTVGHFFIQKLENSAYKFGLIIVDNTKRGKGYGSAMLECALKYAKKTLNAKRIVLSAFDNNLSAYNCYKKIGFKETGKITQYNLFGEIHNYIELEYFYGV